MRRFHTTLFAAVFLLAACSSQPPLHDLPVSSSPVIHAVDNLELRKLMDRMNSLMFERNLTEHELDNQRREVTDRVYNAANDLDQAIEGILAALPGLKLTADEQKVFRLLAVDLRGEARNLKAQAEAHQTEEIPATLAKMTVTCTTCHELFRDFNKTGARP